MSFKTIESPIEDVTGNATITMAINGSAFFRGLTVRSIVFYDAGDNIVTPTGANMNIKCYKDLENLSQHQELPFYTTNMSAGHYEMVSTGTISHLTGATTGIASIEQPVELVEILFTGVIGATKAKVKLVLQKARA